MHKRLPWKSIFITKTTSSVCQCDDSAWHKKTCETIYQTLRQWLSWWSLYYSNQTSILALDRSRLAEITLLRVGNINLSTGVKFDFISARFLHLIKPHQQFMRGKALYNSCEPGIANGTALFDHLRLLSLFQISADLGKISKQHLQWHAFLPYNSF